MPAFVDAHTHLIGYGLASARPSLEGAGSKDEALGLLEEWLDAHPGGEPVIAEGWDDSAWKDGGLTGTDLERLEAGRALCARRVCGHIAAFNREALEAVGTHWDGLDAASGVAREGLSLEIGRLWPASFRQRAAAVQAAQQEALRLGIAGAHEMGDALCFRAFGEADRAGVLRLRIHHFFHSQCDEAVRGAGLTPGAGSEHLRVAGMKYFLDGSIGAGTAAVRTPYPNRGGAGSRGSGGGLDRDVPAGTDRGWLLWKTEALCDAWGRHFREGWPVAAHAIGDGAAEQALTVLEALVADGVSIDFRLEHGEMLPPDLRDRAQALGIGVSMQPNFTANWQGPDGLYERVLGREWAVSLNPYRSVAEAGRLIFGSDTMPMDPIYGMGGALRHPDPSQRLTAPEAHNAYTQAAAAAAPGPFGHGRIAEGEFADWVLLSGVPESARQIDDWEGVQVRATWIGGETVYWDPALRTGRVSEQPGETAKGNA